MIALKTLHLLALVLGLGSGIARLVLAGVALRDAESRSVLAPLLRRLGDMASVGVLLLILSGLALYAATHTGTTQSVAFHLKMLGAAVVAGLAGFSHLKSRSASPLPLPVACRLGQVTVGTAVATTALAVIAFNGG